MKIANPAAALDLDLQVAICEACEVNWEDVLAPGRKTRYIIARQIYAKISSELFPARTLEDVGETLGSRHHTTVIDMLQTAQNMIDTNDEKFCTPYYEVRRALGI